MLPPAAKNNELMKMSVQTKIHVTTGRNEVHSKIEDYSTIQSQPATAQQNL